MKAKDIMKTIGLIGAGFVIGHVKGAIDCYKAIDKELGANHKLSVDSVLWKPIGCKVTKAEIKEIQDEGSAE